MDFVIDCFVYHPEPVKTFPVHQRAPSQSPTYAVSAGGRPDARAAGDAGQSEAGNRGLSKTTGASATGSDCERFGREGQGERGLEEPILFLKRGLHFQ